MSIPGLSKGSLCAHVDPYVRKSQDTMSIPGLFKGSLHAYTRSEYPRNPRILCPSKGSLHAYMWTPMSEYRWNPRILCPSWDCPKVAYLHTCGPLCQSPWNPRILCPSRDCPKVAYMWTPMSEYPWHPRLCPSRDCAGVAYVHPYVRVSVKSQDAMSIPAYMHTCGPLRQSIHEIPGYYVHPGIVQR